MLRTPARCLVSETSTEARYPHVWQMVDYYEGQLASAITQYRWAMVLLDRVYANKIAQLRDNNCAASSSSSNTRRRNGKGKASTDLVLKITLAGNVERLLRWLA